MENQKPLNELKIMIVDDDDISRIIYEKVLGELFHLICASNGEDAIAALECNTDISLVILDIYMPGISGFHVLEAMKNSARWKKIPVLMCTASENGTNVEKALEMGATDCITKPIQPQIMRKRVINIIQREYLERRNLENTLENTASRLHLLMETIPGGIMELKMSKDNQIQTTYFNDTICSLAGVSRKEFTERYDGNLLPLIYESDRHVVMDSLTGSMNDQSNMDLVFRIYRHNNAPVWVHLLGTRYVIQKQDVIYHVLLFDITNEKTAELNAEVEAQRFRYLAEHDSLTGINNRKAFCDKTWTMLRENPDKNYVLLCWDVEKFKVINDIYGVETGNRILKTLAMHFASVMLGVGTYGRLGDDHFAICYPVDLYSPQEAFKAAKKALGGIHINNEIGICMGVYYIEDIDIPISSMCDRANMALAKTKGNYLENYAFYDTELIEQLVKEQELCKEMEHALATEEFQIYVQPKYDLLTNQIVGGEALVRWVHPKNGLIAPGEFIPLFEKNGAIVKLDSYVWEKTCRYLHEWKEENLPVVPLSINISRINFVNIDVAKVITNLVEKYELDSDILELEVTESVYADDHSIFYKELEKLQTAGFKILMDDFGSGYSSFNMLKEAPVDGLKLDLKFLSGSDDKNRANKILAAIMYMAKLIDMEVIAEGVESVEHVNLLKEIHCDTVQGYHFSRPVPIEVFQQMLLDQQEHKIEKQQEYEELLYQQYVRKQRRYNDRRGTILIGEDTEISQEVLQSLLVDNCNMIVARDGREAYKLIQENAADIDLVILDIYMPKMDGFSILRHMKSDNILSEIPVIIMSSNDSLDAQIMAFKYGAIDYLAKPFIPELVKARVFLAMSNALKMREIKQQSASYKHRATLDPMTGLYNKVTLENMTNQLFAQHPHSIHGLMVLDVDNFKSVNDCRGHLEGDFLIKQVSTLISQRFREEDIVGRIGGDEFVVVMSNLQNKEAARKKADELIKTFEHAIGENKSIYLTLSIGLAFAPENGTGYREVFSKADRALYRAKSLGKSQYVEYEER